MKFYNEPHPFLRVSIILSGMFFLCHVLLSAQAWNPVAPKPFCPTGTSTDQSFDQPDFFSSVGALSPFKFHPNQHKNNLLFYLYVYFYFNAGGKSVNLSWWMQKRAH